MSGPVDSAQASAGATGGYSTRSGLSKSWRTVKTHAGVYTGGKVELFHGRTSADSEPRALMACMLHNDVAIIDAETGELQRTLQQDVEDEDAKESFVVFAVRPGKKNQLVTAGRNLLLRVWDLDTFKCVRTIKAHETPVLAMGFDPSGTLLATGGSDRTVKVFDVDKGFCTHNFRGHSGIVTLVQFHPDAAKLTLVSASDDATVRVWDLYTQKQVACIQDHMSLVTSVAFSEDGYTMLSAGRDKVVNFWDLRDHKLSKTVLVHEAVEGLVVVPSTFKCVTNASVGPTQDSKAIHFLTAGEMGALRLWRSSGNACETLFTQKPDASSALTYTELLLSPARREVVVVSSEQNFLVLDEKLSRRTQIIGYNDDILNLKYVPKADASGEPSDVLAVATNSEQIRLLHRSTLSCDLLSGHTDIVMALSVSPDGRWLVSASKDRTARLWDLRPNGGKKMGKTLPRCVATCVGHTEALGAVAISQRASSFATGAAFFVTGSSDKTLKMWSLQPLAGTYAASAKAAPTELTISTLGAVKAHDKDVNALAVSPNDRFIASASQDKLIKVWHSQQGGAGRLLTLAGVCRGHKRGVWAVEFSPVDQCLASASGDKTVKVWSAKDFSCLKTFEGHTASVLNVQFACAGMQLLSAGADGLVKLWTIKSNECEATLDNHEDKIWALAVSKDSSEMVSGGADSTINLWRDFTDEEERTQQDERGAKLLKEQELFNCLRSNKLLDAIQLAFELNHPNRMLQILRDLLEGPRHKDQPSLPGGKPIDPDNFSPEDIFAPVVHSLENEQLTTLMDWLRDWNTNARNTSVCQVLVSTILRELPPSRLKSLDGVSKTVEALIAYSDRHFQRIDRMLQKSYLVDFSIVTMKSLLPVGESESVNEKTSSDSEADEEEAKEQPRKRGKAATTGKSKKQRV
ncbi:Transducin beta-like protein 3 [Phytophthora fragariae]|uniref:Transducin beta-like protein 3 n=2 Tax=Phytophthora TaxID=4783 RepID=A0A6A3TPP8_9STRA|nr:Transducin beta-like protein 3 [Phytophthora fragariae]KAE8934689.1 Transducin beta-like protein 3 [Phytophthora fragariae]KAE9004223.1 Transducin beta-like protein 3 [Phytophthora fragariae]KAE9103522.1 Transducin beta-like protein 3 [Phytophthora fragariae]KAE9104604.1 Transducin beta-like protein 3 [Phytophthora fragariae]